MTISRKEREHKRQRKEILEVAERLFARKSFYKVTMQEIAKKSEFSVGTIYNFFKSKDHLYMQVVWKKAREIDRKLRNAIAEKDTIMEKIDNFLRAKAEFFQENKEFIRLYFMETQGVTFSFKQALDKKLRRLYDEFLKHFSEIFAQGIKERLFKPIDPYYLALTLDGLSNTFFMNFILLKKDIKLEGYISVIKEIFFDGAKRKKGDKGAER